MCNLSWTPHFNLEKDNSLKTTPVLAQRWAVCIGGSRGGAWGARAPPRAFEIDFFFMNIFVGVRVLPNWLIDS